MDVANKFYDLVTAHIDSLDPTINFQLLSWTAHGYIVLHAVCPACRVVRCLFFEQFCSRRTVVAEQ